MDKNAKTKKLKKWMKKANFQELNEKLYLLSEELSDMREEYMLLRKEIIQRDKKGNAYKIKVKGNVLALTRDDINTTKLQNVVQSISYNTTHLYEIDEKYNFDLDRDYDAICDSEPHMMVQDAFNEIASERLIFEALDYIYNCLWFVFRIDTKNGDYLFVDYTIDTGLYAGFVEVIRKKKQAGSKQCDL